jgi:hypothetical protein
MKALKSLLGVVILVGIVYGLWLFFPPYLASYQLEDHMETTSRLSAVAYPPKTDDDIRNAVMQEVRNLKIPLTPEQVNVQRNGSDIVIWADYTVRVDVPVYPVDLTFHPASKNKNR